MTEQTWSYPAHFERHDDGEIVVTFPDFPEAITGASTDEEAAFLAADALEEVVLAYLAEGRAVPAPHATEEGFVEIPLDPLTAARAALVTAMRESGTNNTALAARLGRSEGAVRRLLTGTTGVKIDTVLDALRAMGRQAKLSVGQVA